MADMTVFKYLRLNPMQYVMQGYFTIIEKYQKQQNMDDIGKLSDTMLQDIGLTRADLDAHSMRYDSQDTVTRLMIAGLM